MTTAARLYAALALLTLTACGSGNVGSLPPTQYVDPSAGLLQFGVGIATVNYAGTRPVQPVSCFSGVLSGSPPYYGANFVESFRQPNGLASALYDVPTISGPSGFVGDTTPDGKPTASIFRSFQLLGGIVATGAPTSAIILNPLGAFGFGFGQERTTGAPVFGVPITPAADFARFSCASYFGLSPVGGPPAWPYVSGGFPVGEGGGTSGNSGNAFPGYPMGFLTYLSTSPVPAGPYRLDVGIPTGIATKTVSATATLRSTRALPVFPTPQVQPDVAHPGGLIVDVVVPSGLAEAFVEVQADPYGFTSNYSIPVPTNVPGTVRVVVPALLGAPGVNSTKPTPSFISGANYQAYAIGFDYDMFGASYPANRSQRPAITGSNGQADLTISDVAFFTYP